MATLAVFVFISVFALIAGVSLFLSKPGSSKQNRAFLASALGQAAPVVVEASLDLGKDNLLSSIPWLNLILDRLDISTKLRRLLIQANLEWTVGKLVLITTGTWALSASLINLKTHALLLSFLLALAPAAGPIIYVSRKRNKRLFLMLEQLPEALDLMVGALKAGQSMTGAFGAASRESSEPLAKALRNCFDEQNFGINLRLALDNMLERHPIHDLRIVATAMMLHKESGGNLAEILSKTSHIIRDRYILKQKVRVHTAQGRLTGIVLLSLPFCIGLVIYCTSPDYLNLLFTRSLGHKLMATAAVLNTIGLLIIRRITDIRP